MTTWYEDEPIYRAYLTPRQTEVLQLAAEGYTYREIAHMLGRSVYTVKSHLWSRDEGGHEGACVRLGARSIAHAVAIGLRKGLIE